MKKTSGLGSPWPLLESERKKLHETRRSLNSHVELSFGIPIWLSPCTSFLQGELQEPLRREGSVGSAGSGCLSSRLILKGGGSRGTAIHCFAGDRAEEEEESGVGVGGARGSQVCRQGCLGKKHLLCFAEALAQPWRVGSALWRPLLWLRGADTSLGGGRSGNFPREGNGNPRQYPYLENPMDREAWCPCVHKESDTTERLHYLST